MCRPQLYNSHIHTNIHMYTHTHTHTNTAHASTLVRLKGEVAALQVTHDTHLILILILILTSPHLTSPHRR